MVFLNKLLTQKKYPFVGYCGSFLNKLPLQKKKKKKEKKADKEQMTLVEAAYVERCDDQPAPDPACCFDCPVDPAPAEQ